MKIDKLRKIETKTTKLTNYKEFEKIVSINKEDVLKRKIQEAADYVEYIKTHDEEAYKNYLSYSTYLKI